MSEKIDDLVEKLVKKYYLKITQDCIELSPKIENAFIIREQVVSKIKDAVDKS